MILDRAMANVPCYPVFGAAGPVAWQHLMSWMATWSSEMERSRCGTKCWTGVAVSVFENGGLIGRDPVNITRLEFMNWQLDTNDSIEERIARDSYESLTDPERTYHAIWWLLFVTYGPGLLDYFNNTEPSKIAIALNGLATIQADEMRYALQEALDALPTDYFTHSARSRSDSLPQSVVDTIYEIENRFTECAYPKEELARFVELNDIHFCGPRTKLELWNSMTQVEATRLAGPGRQDRQ
jgi:hypothetical protein